MVDPPGGVEFQPDGLPALPALPGERPAEFAQPLHDHLAPAAVERDVDVVAVVTEGDGAATAAAVGQCSMVTASATGCRRGRGRTSALPAWPA